MDERIHLATPHMSEKGYELEYIKDAFKKNWIAPLGENVDSFEQEICELTGAGYATAVVSGTAAIHLALKHVGVGAGDIVLCQSLTFVGSVNPVLYENATPVFIDSEEDGWNIDPDLLEKAIIKYQPKAVIAVHLYGLPAQIKRIQAICKTYGVALIEDAAESLATLVDGQWTGRFGDYGIYSFNGNKIITTSGGGMLISDNEEAVTKSRYWATQAREDVRHYEHLEVGYNYRLSNISAGIGRGQLKVLQHRLEQKRTIFHAYKEGLKDIEDISFITERDNERANYWLSAFVLSEDSPITANQIIDELEKNNIEARPVWKPMHLQAIFKDYDFVGGERAEKLFNHGLCLPSDTKMTQEELNKVLKVIKGLWSK